MALPLVALAVVAAAAAGRDWTIERLYRRPFVWGSLPERVTWSKQGHTLLFLWDAAGGRFRDLYAHRTRDTEASPQLSSAGEKLAFSRQGQLYVQDLASGQLTQITDLEGRNERLAGYCWSPDGRHFIYWVRRGPERRVPLPNYSGRFVVAPTFPRTVAGDEARETSFYTVPAGGGKPLALEAGPWGARGYPGAPKWSPGSRRILAAFLHPQMKRRQLLVYEPGRPQPAVLDEERDERWVEPAVSDWSPDSRHMAGWTWGTSWAAVNDWENDNAFYTGQRLNSPQSNPEAYRRSSPIHFSGNLKDRLLIVHGMADDNVLFQDAVQLAGKLIQEGKDFEQISYPQESHAFLREETLRDAFRRTAEFFDRHLK